MLRAFQPLACRAGGITKARGGVRDTPPTFPLPSRPPEQGESRANVERPSRAFLGCFAITWPRDSFSAAGESRKIQDKKLFNINAPRMPYKARGALFVCLRHGGKSDESARRIETAVRPLLANLKRSRGATSAQSSMRETSGTSHDTPSESTKSAPVPSKDRHTGRVLSVQESLWAGSALRAHRSPHEPRPIARAHAAPRAQ
jgi:hypothetical protein